MALAREVSGARVGVRQPTAGPRVAALPVSGSRVRLDSQRSASLRQGVACQVAAPAAAVAATSSVPVYKGDLFNRSYYPTAVDASNVTKRWYIIDAEGQTLGRLATLAAWYIRGKHMPTYSPSMDMGAYVIVINADKVVVTGNKFNDKTYFNHVNGRPGSYRMETFKDLQKRIPERILERAVQGMLPKGSLGRKIRLHLKVYKGTEHPHEAQQPTPLTSEISIKPKESAGAALLASKRAAAGVA